MRARWNALAPRERLLLLCAAAVLLAALLYLAVWEPLVKSNQRLRGDVSQLRSNLSWLRSVEPEVSRLRGRNMGVANGGTLLNLVDQGSKSNGLASSITRLQPEGEKEVRLWFDQVSYESLMRWVLELETAQGVQVAELNVGRTANAGMVSARLILRRP